MTNQRKGLDWIPREDFARVLLAFKEEHGYSWSQLGRMCGRSTSHISTLGSKYTGAAKIKKSVADDIMRRLNGEHLTPTKMQVRQYDERQKRLQREQRSETLKRRKLEERLARINELSIRLGAGPLEPPQN